MNKNFDYNEHIFRSPKFKSVVDEAADFFIQKAENLQSTEFQCRFMILNGVEGDLVVPVEANLIRRYKPLWNMIVDGFGNHDPGSG